MRFMTARLPNCARAVGGFVIEVFRPGLIVVVGPKPTAPTRLRPDRISGLVAGP
jgi:hypothetical protein